LLRVIRFAGAGTPNRLRGKEPRMAGPATHMEQSNEETLRLLVVEDHVDSAEMLSRLLQNFGYHVRTANTAADARELVTSESFDVMLSDLGLPDEDGYELMSWIRQRHATKGIAMSGFGMDEDVRRSRAAGFSEHVVKPVDVLQLDQVIRRVIAR
jgi:CheY-like chemotaxis protein